VVLNEKLLDVLGDEVTQDQAFAHANDVLKNAVGGSSDIILDSAVDRLKPLATPHDRPILYSRPRSPLG